jgi:hypothetical protein
MPGTFNACRWPFGDGVIAVGPDVAMGPGVAIGPGVGARQGPDALVGTIGGGNSKGAYDSSGAGIHG